MRSLLFILSLGSLVACGGGSDPDAGSNRDASLGMDAGGGDGGLDAGAPDDDAGRVDAGGSDGGGSDGGALDGGPGDASPGTDAGSCVPRTDDASGIGDSCTTAANCPPDYVCFGFSGIVVSYSCEIPCSEDCECPTGTVCRGITDKAGTHFYCRP